MISKVIKALKRHKRFLIATHINAEPDALGSQLALARLLIILGKKVIVCNDGLIPPECSFLPFIKTIKRPKDISSKDFDVAVAVDCSDLSRLGNMAKIIPGDKLILNIDHHIRNSKFAKVNWIDLQASSCAEQIYQIYKKLNIHIEKKVALLLYSAIVSDTGSFKYSNTTFRTHKIAGELLHYRLPVHKIYQNIYENISFCGFQMILKILSTIQRAENGKIVYFEQKNKNLRSGSTRLDLSGYIMNIARAIKEVELVIFFKQSDDKNGVRVNFRSKGKVDVSRLAQFFGGGGHKTASGCSLRVSFNLAKRLVLKKAKSLLTK